MKRTLFLSTLLLVFAISTSWGAIPETISYQGVLTDATGVAVPDGTYNLTFKLYDAPTGGTDLWTEPQTVTVSKGIFNVMLGKVNPLTIPFDEPYWLGISVNGGAELTARTPLAASPYSLNTRSGGGGSGNTLDQAYDQGGAGAGRTITADAGAVNIAGPDGLTVNGRVSIGMLSPVDRRLEVKGGGISLTNEATHSSLVLQNFNSAGWLNDIQFVAARGSVASPMPLQNNDVFGFLDFRGYDGSGLFPEVAFITAEVDGDTGVGDLPSRLLFLTTPDGSSTPIERIRIDNKGNVGIGTTSPGAKLELAGLGSNDGLYFNGNTQVKITTTEDTGTDSLRIAGQQSKNAGLYITPGGEERFSILELSSGPSHTTRAALIHDGRSGELMTRLDLLGSTHEGFAIRNNAGAEIFHVKSSGNVGIGTINPGNILTIQQNSPTEPGSDHRRSWRFPDLRL